MKKIALFLGIWMILISPFSYSMGQNVNSDKILTEIVLKEKVGGDCISGALALALGLSAILTGGATTAVQAAFAVLFAIGGASNVAQFCFNGSGGSGSGGSLPEPCSNGGSPERNWACSQNGGSNMGPVNAPNAHPDDVCCQY